MTTETFDRSALMLDVLNRLADSAHLDCISLVLLNFDFSAQESQAIMDFVAEKQVKRQPLSKQQCAEQVAQIKPGFKFAAEFVDQFKHAALAEGRFPDVLNH